MVIIVKKVEFRFILGDIIQLVLYNIFKYIIVGEVRIAKWLVDWHAMIKDHGSSPEDNFFITGEDFIVKNWCKVRKVCFIKIRPPF
jgi:hypothetical protein